MSNVGITTPAASSTNPSVYENVASESMMSDDFLHSTKYYSKCQEGLEDFLEIWEMW